MQPIIKPNLETWKVKLEEENHLPWFTQIANS